MVVVSASKEVVLRRGRWWQKVVGGGSVVVQTTVINVASLVNIRGVPFRSRGIEGSIAGDVDDVMGIGGRASGGGTMSLGLRLGNFSGQFLVGLGLLQMENLLMERIQGELLLELMLLYALDGSL